MTFIKHILKIFLLVYFALFFDLQLLIDFCINCFNNSLNVFFLFAPLYFNIFVIIFLIFCPKKYFVFLRNFSLFCSLFIFLFYLFTFIFVHNLETQSYYFFHNFFLFYNINLIFAIDGINIFFLLLISLLIPICILLSWNIIVYNFKLYLVILFCLELLLFCTFLSFNLFFFYFFFESTMIPMFLLIGIWGSRQRKIHAVYYFFFYTIFGSIFLLSGLLLLYSSTFTFNWFILNNINFSFELQIALFVLFFIGFCVKIPMVPFHIWLPEAHVEAPTAGSVLLAGILLKIGSYGLLRFVVTLFPLASIFFTPFIYVLCIISILYISAIAIRQVDMKKIIAYSSVAHMNFVVLGLFSTTVEGIAGSVFLMISHGIVSSALFICVAIIYDRYNTRLLSYYGSMVTVMPIYSIFFFLFILANISFPGTSNFVGEFLVLVGVFENNLFITFLAVFSIILSAIYSIWLINRILFGNFKTVKYRFSDLSKREFYILLILLFFTFSLGIFPTVITDKLEIPTYLILNKFY